MKASYKVATLIAPTDDEITAYLNAELLAGRHLKTIAVAYSPLVALGLASMTVTMVTYDGSGE